MAFVPFDSVISPARNTGPQALADQTGVRQRHLASAGRLGPTEGPVVDLSAGSVPGDVQSCVGRAPQLVVWLPLTCQSSLPANLGSSTHAKISRGGHLVIARGDRVSGACFMDSVEYRA